MRARARRLAPRHALAALGLAGALAGVSAPTAGAWERAGTGAQDGILVRFEASADASDRIRLRAAAGVRVDRGLPVPGLQLVRPRRGVSLAAAVAELERRADVRYAEPNAVRHALAIPNDPLFDQLWGLRNAGQAVGTRPAGTPGADIGAPAAWDLTTGSDVVVAVIDTGVAYDHPDLAPNVWTNPGESGGGRETNGVDDDRDGYVDDVHGWDFVDGDNVPLDLEGHGTHVAGTLAARGDNGIGGTGVAWRARIMPLRAGDQEGAFTVANLIAAYGYAARRGARVINASFGGGEYSQAEADAIAAARDTLFAVAAGNEGASNDAVPAYPCDYPNPNVICVGAIGLDGALAGFSNFGAAQVDLVAPGVEILSDVPASTTAFSEDFEGPGAAGRIVTGGAPAGWALTTLASHSPTTSVTDSPAGAYAPSQDNFVRIKDPFSLAGKADCVLDYRLRAETEPRVDGVLVEASSDGVAWTAIDGGSGTTGGAFLPLTALLRAFSGQPAVWVRARLQSDATVQFDGAYLDDLLVRCPSSTYTGTETRFLSGTSMAAPHLAGVAALVWSQIPDASVSYVRGAILGGVTVDERLRSLVATAGRLNARGALDGEPPRPFALAGPPTGAELARTRPELAWTPSSDAKSGLRDYELVIDGKASATAIDPTSTSARPADALAQGRHTWTVRAVDRAGFAAEAAPARSFIVDTRSPRVRARVSARALRGLTRGGGLRVALTVDEPVRATAAFSIAVPRSTRRTLGRGAPTRIRARRSLGVPGRGRTVTLRIDRKERAALGALLRARRAVRLEVSVAARDAAGNAARTRARGTLR